MRVKVLIAEHDLTLRNRIRETVQSVGEYEVAGVARDGQEAVQAAVEFAPHVALISYDLPGIPGPKTCEMLSALSPDVMTVLISDEATQERSDAAMRSGARALVAGHPGGDQLASLIAELADVRERRESAEFLAWKDLSRFPRIVAVTGARGGVGKTTVAVNLAAVLAKRMPNQVVVVDLHAQFGDIATMFDVAPRGAIADIVPICEEIDGELVRDYVTEHSSGVHILVMSLNPLPLDAVTVQCLDNLLYVLKRMYRYIIVDVPSILHESSVHVLAHSNVILLIANLFDLTTAADTRKYYDALKSEHIPADNVRVVLNRVSRINELQAADIEEMFDCGVLAYVPNDSRLVTAANQGVPFVLSDSGSPFEQSMMRIAQSIAGSGDDATGAAGTPPKRGIFGLRLWGGHERSER